MSEITWSSPEGRDYIVEYKRWDGEILFHLEAVFDDTGNEVDIDGIGADWFEEHKESIFDGCHRAIKEVE